MLKNDYPQSRNHSGAWKPLCPEGGFIALEPMNENTRRNMTIHDNIVLLSKMGIFYPCGYKMSLRYFLLAISIYTRFLFDMDRFVPLLASRRGEAILKGGAILRWTGPLRHELVARENGMAIATSEMACVAVLSVVTA
jgi:hypothetical protein